MTIKKTDKWRTPNELGKLTQKHLSMRKKQVSKIAESQ